MAYQDSSSASGQDEPWIQWFCNLKGHEMYCKVERSYIEDGFNLYGLRAYVSNFSDCIDLILDRIGPDESDDSHLTQSACTLYGLIHARYIITAHGLDAMYNKYANKEFGTCPLIQCYGQPVLPVGLRDEMGAETVKVFCPKCQNVYHPPPMRSKTSSSNSNNNYFQTHSHSGSGPFAQNNYHNGGGSTAVDGAAFGTTFAHLFLMTFNNLVPDRLPKESKYVPKVFGFRVHPSARQRNGSNNSILNNNSGGSGSGKIAGTLKNMTTAHADVQVDHALDGPSVPLQGDRKNDITVTKPSASCKDDERTTTENIGNDQIQQQQTSKSKSNKGKNSKIEETSGSSKRRGKSDHESGKSKRQRRP